MSTQRKLGRPTDQRRALLKGLVTSLIRYGRIETTETRAMEVASIAESLIAMAERECDNFTSKTITVSAPVKDSKGYKSYKTVTSKNGNKYQVVERAKRQDLRSVDAPSRLAARRSMMQWLYRIHDEDGKSISLTNKLLNDLGPKFKGVKGGYTRISKLGVRRGDGAPICVLEFTK